MRDVERLRKPMQQIAHFLIEHMTSDDLDSQNSNGDISAIFYEERIEMAD